MADKTIPWWRKALQFAIGGIRSGFGLFSRPAKPEPLQEDQLLQSPEASKEVEEVLTHPSPNPEVAASVPEAVAEQSPAAEPLAEPAIVLAEPAIAAEAVLASDPPPVKLANSIEEEAIPSEVPGAVVEQAVEPAPQEQPPAPTPVPEPAPEPEAEPEPQPVIAPDPEPVPLVQPPSEPELEAVAEAEPAPEQVPEIDQNSTAESEPTSTDAVVPSQTDPAIDPAPEPIAAAVVEPEPITEPEPEPAAETTPTTDPESAAEAPAESTDLPVELVVEEIVPNSKRETEAASAEPEPDVAPEPVAEPAPTAASDPQVMDRPADLPEEERESISEPEAEQTPESEPLPAAEPAPAAEMAPSVVAAVEPAASEAPEPPHPAKPLIKLESRDNQADLSPFSVIVAQVYDGPLDLLLDLIRKQDIDIYDIPIAKITAQFLAYVNQLKATDVDVAGEFIYTASLLIHIKSKMLLPRAPAGPDDAAEDPRRELVERLLEHERFKNAAQMLQQKQMLEAATWTNPGFREFREDAAAEPEIEADTVDLVRIFRDILERARNRPILNVEEDTVTVGQMIQFLARRLTMEDKPVALRRLLSHTRSERALIAMFLALLELVRLQAVLLRQDLAFSEIFIKKHTSFEAVMNEGLANARDDWK